MNDNTHYVTMLAAVEQALRVFHEPPNTHADPEGEARVALDTIWPHIEKREDLLLKAGQDHGYSNGSQNALNHVIATLQSLPMCPHGQHPELCARCHEDNDD